MQIDTVIRLVPLPGLGDRVRGKHRIRILEVNGRSILPELLKWQKSSPGVWKSILRRLELISEYEDLPRLDTVKRVGREKVIIEIVLGSARLLGFEDQDGHLTFVCAETFWIKGGNKLAQQDKAIRRAEQLRERWMNAMTLEGVPDTRIERR